MTMAPFQPRAQWHVYRSYADMSGSMAPVERGGFLSGLASVNAADGKAHILLGNDGTQAFTTNVTIQNLSQLANYSTTGKVRVRVREIPYPASTRSQRPLKSPMPSSHPGEIKSCFH